MQDSTKLIGLLGGTSWPSTLSYYRYLNQKVNELSGAHHSARILLYSIDYHPIKNLYHDGWNEIPSLLEKEITFFLEKKPDCLILCNNTLHRALDLIWSRLKIHIPFYHAGHLAAKEARAKGYNSILLLGTRFTMEDGFFARYFEEQSIKVVTPNAKDRQEIQEIQSQVASGSDAKNFESMLLGIVNRYQAVDAIVLACTELPLVLHSAHRPLIDPAISQCNAALKEMLVLSV